MTTAMAGITPDELDVEQSEAVSPPDLPAHWQVVQVGEAYHFTRKPRELRFSNYDAIPFVPMEYIPVGQAIFDQYLLKAAEELTSGTYFESGDILVSKITPSFENGKQGIIENLPLPFGIATTEVIPIKEVEQVSDKFFLFYHLLRGSVRAFLAGKMEGSTGRQRLSKSTLEKLVVPLPPLPEQRAIVRVLRAVEQAIQARRQEVAHERERKAALMQHLFTHGTRGEPRKQTEFGEVPQSWQVVQLGELCIGSLGTIQTGPFGSQLHASDYQQTGVPVVNPTHLGFNTIVKDRLPFVKREDADRLSKHYLALGDILISRRGDFSRFSFITERESGWLCGTGCLLIRIKNPYVDNYFVSVSISTERVQEYLSQNAVGSIMPNLNTKILSQMPILLPPVAEQREIGAALRGCDKRITTLEHERTLLEELFRAMLEELMTGRLSTLPLVTSDG